MTFQTHQLRNIAVAGHGQTGKTTLFEQILFSGGAISKAESVESGKTTSDNSTEEIQRKISVYASLAHLEHGEELINIWDTPGSSDFAGEVISAFRACDSAVMMIDARSGAQIETIKLWRYLDAHGKPRMLFVSHCDDPRANFAGAVKDVHDKFRVEVCPVSIPMISNNKFAGVIDVLHNKAYPLSADGKKEEAVPVPEGYAEAREEALAVLAGSAAEGDDDLFIKFIDEGELSSEEIVRGLKAALANNKIVPAFAGCPAQGSGIACLLDFISEIAPSPDLFFETARTASDEVVSARVSADEKRAVLCVKTASDQFSGRLSYLKVVGGVLRAESELYNIREGRKEKIGKLYRCTGKKLDEIHEASAGDICIAAKLASVHAGDSLTEDQDAPAFSPLEMPHPTYSMSVSAEQKKDEDRMSELLARAAEDDRTLSFRYDAETRQNVLSGMGELHIGIILERVQAQAKIAIETGVPRVAYRETVQRKAQAEYTHKKQSGGHGQYGRVSLSVEPLARGEGYRFTNAVFGGAISKNYIPGVEKGVKEAMEQGVLAGYPVVDAGTTVLDGKEHPVDSSELAFKIAARNAFRDAMRSAGPILLEPVMNITVWVESRYLGDIMSDLSGRRGRILGQNPLGGGIEEIRAQVPQAELLRYAIELRSITSGTGSFETSFSHYDPLSGKLADEVIKAAKAFMSQSGTED